MHVFLGLLSRCSCSSLPGLEFRAGVCSSEVLFFKEISVSIRSTKTKLCGSYRLGRGLVTDILIAQNRF